MTAAVVAEGQPSRAHPPAGPSVPVRTGRRRHLLGDPGNAMGDAGNAMVEFLGASLLLLVPVVYLVVVLAEVQSATFAVDAAAREAARAVVTAAPGHGEQRARAAVGLALADQGLDPRLAERALSVRCSATCTEPGSTVTVLVLVDVELPGLPGGLADAVPLRIPVSATVTAPVDSFRGAFRGAAGSA